jgi:poly(hydroxyalkanoate) granule-associated protein
MADAIRMRPAEGAGAAARDAGATVGHVARRVWRAGLGALAVTAEQAREVLAALEQKGKDLEPAVTAPLKRAGGAATRVAGRAGTSVKNVSGEMSRLVDEKLAAALERLDVPTRADLRALADRVEELAPKSKRTRESHHED